jgi:hypothetical protein
MKNRFLAISPVIPGGAGAAPRQIRPETILLDLKQPLAIIGARGKQGEPDMC